MPAGTTLFNAAHWAGLPIESTCGGKGTCKKCKVRITAGEVTEANAWDHRALSDDEIAAGWRLACQSLVSDDAECEVPNLMRAPKAATMGVGRFVLLEPNVHKVYVELPEPSIDDARSDLQRLSDALDAEGYGVSADAPALRRLSEILRSAGFRVTAVLAGEHLVAVEPGDTHDVSYGVAFDIGTTTVVGTLMNLRTGMAEHVTSALNRQAMFGADVITRIAHAMHGRAAIEELRAAVLVTVNDLLSELLSATGVRKENVYEMVVAGNATMLHLLLGVDPHPIALSPFVAAFLHPLDLPATEAGVGIHPEGRVQTFPSLGAYVGADIVSDVLATGLAKEDHLRLLVDVGTNGEIVLGSSERLVATSAPAGPAFEGAQIRCGMRAAEGAIEGVSLGSEVELQVIGGEVEPLGICGSGLIDAVAQLLHAELLEETGRLAGPEEAAGHPLADHLEEVDGLRAFRLAEGIHLTQVDIRELQSAKAAIATGIEILMERMAIEPEDLHEILLAGSFGTYINPESAVAIGLVPAVATHRIVSVGNAAGEGAKMGLLSFREREIAFELPARMEYVELSGSVGFNDRFLRILRFPPLEKAAVG